jgi:phytoene desaturase
VSLPPHQDRAVLFCMVNAPALQGAAMSASDVQRVRDHIVSEIDRRFCPGITARIRAEVVLTAHDIERTGSAHGSIYGAAPHGTTSTFERPKYRADFAQGVYFVGGATHPGGGVPMVIRGGRFVADTIVSDRRTAPSAGGISAIRRWFR